MSLLSRVITALIGSLLGGVMGMLSLYLLMLLGGSNFGLDNVRPGLLLGVAVGFLVDLRCPTRLSWLDLFLWP